MAARVSAEAAGPSYASVLNFRGGDSNKENIEASPVEVVDAPPVKQQQQQQQQVLVEDGEEEEGFVPVISHTRKPAKVKREKDRRGAPPRPHKAMASHMDAHQTSDQQQHSSDAQPKKFVEAPIPKVNPWQVSAL